MWLYYSGCLGTWKLCPSSFGVTRQPRMKKCYRGPETRRPREAVDKDVCVCACVCVCVWLLGLNGQVYCLLDHSLRVAQTSRALCVVVEGVPVASHHGWMTCLHLNPGSHIPLYGTILGHQGRGGAREGQGRGGVRARMSYPSPRVDVFLLFFFL